MKRVILISLVLINIVSFSQTTKTVQELKLEKRNLENQVNLLKSQIKQIDTQISKIESGEADIVFEGSGNNRIEAKAASGGAILRDKGVSTGNILATIKAGEPVLLYKEKNGLYIKAAYNGNSGWVSYTSIASNTELDNFMTEKNQTKQVNTTNISTVDTNSPDYKRLSKLYGHERALKILNKQLWKGMSHGMVVESLGQPSERKSVNTPEGLKEEWIYSNKKIIFLNGSLDSWK
jgi:hypothetical protein